MMEDTRWKESENKGGYINLSLYYGLGIDRLGKSYIKEAHILL